MSDPRSIARRVIAAEAAALEALTASLDDSFDQAVESILNSNGRVVVTGIGKSGHIARKIAATFASTGTPAQFVHPAEASHGDLGMITSADLVLAISNSGEAPELANLIAYARRFGILLVAMTSREDSALGRQADILLRLPVVEEACGTGIVPSSSTTVTLALGDALAIALMEQRAFTPENFRAFHPGGKLGARLSHVADLMQTGETVPLVKPDTPMADVLIEMSRKSFGVVGVQNADNCLVGIITDGDLRRHMQGLLDLTAKDVMTTSPKTISSTSLAEDAVKLMNDLKITSLFVVDDPDAPPKGLLRIHDCLRVGLA